MDKGIVKLAFVLAVLLVFTSGVEKMVVEGRPTHVEADVDYDYSCKKYCTGSNCHCNNKNQCVCVGNATPLFSDVVPRN
ncbi:hypothetical protein LINPERPRIM_LOCUS31014 [Linum perenne]